MKSYYRLMLGSGSVYAAECFANNLIGADFDIHEDLTGKFDDDWRLFSQHFIPVYLNNRPDKTKIGAGLACGMLWTITKGLKKGDIVLCPDGAGIYWVGEISGDYYYAPQQHLQHRRNVHWLPTRIARAAMSEPLRNSTGSIGTVCNISSYQQEIERFLDEGSAVVTIEVSEPAVEDPVAFAMEKHLEAFLVANWNQTELSKDFEIYQENGDLIGQQYATDAGPIDILAISKDKKRLLIVELKRGRASDVVVGQILRYMGYVKEQIAEEFQSVEGVIIALEDDKKLRWALAAVLAISFYRYQVSFKLVKG